MKKWRPDRLAVRAYRVVRTAMKHGYLMRPDACDRCGLPSPPRSDGRSTIHAHHHDYARPLDIEWLCVICHRQETPVASGQRNGATKLTEKDVAEIRNSGLPTRTLISRYSINRRTVQRIKNGEHWAHLRTGGTL